MRVKRDALLTARDYITIHVMFDACPGASTSLNRVGRTYRSAAHCNKNHNIQSGNLQTSCYAYLTGKTSCGIIHSIRISITLAAINTLRLPYPAVHAPLEL